MLWGLKPVEAKPAYGLAVDGLRRQIHTGLLLPNERLPAERDLAVKFGISRVTLREALRILESQHYIYVRRGAKGGAFVAKSAQLNIMAHHHLVSAPALVMRVVEFLAINQLAAVRLAALRRSSAHLARLRQALEMMEQAQDAYECKQAQTLFFLGLGDAAQNTLLARALEEGMAELFLPCDIQGGIQEEIAQNLTLFHNLLDGLEREDVDMAVNAMRCLHDHLWSHIRQIIRHDSTKKLS